MPPTTRRARDAALEQKRRDDMIVALVNSEYKHSETEFADYFKKCARWYDLYRGIQTRNYHGFRNNISIPFLYSVIQSDVARKVQMSFGQFPYINFEGYAPEAEGVAKKNELLVSVQFEDCRLYRKAVDFFTCADLYGVAIMREGWRRDTRQEKVRVPHYSAPGVIEDREALHWVNYFDGPDATVVDPLDFRPQPGFASIDEMTWCIYRYYLDLDNMRDQVDAELAAGEEPSFDPEALDLLAREGDFTAGMQGRMIDRMSYYRTPEDWARRGEKYAKPVEVWERWGKVPSEMAWDGQRSRRIVILNGRVVGRNAPHPYAHGQKPFSSYAVGDPHFFHGIGKSELLAPMQAASNRLMNHKLDSLDLSISPTVLVSSGSGLDSSRPLHMTPGKIIQLDGPVGEDQVRPLEVDLRGIEHAGAEIEVIWRYMQQGSGIVEDTVSGGPSSGRQTAREFQGRQEGVMTRLMLESRIAEEMWLEPLANRFRALNRQFLPVPRQLKMLGSMALINQNTGLPLPPEEMELRHEDLWPDYTARAVGANQNMLRSMQRQDIVQLLQAASANPILMQMVNWSNFARQMFITFGFRNINELLIQFAPVEGALDAIQAGGVVGGGAADSTEGAPPAPLSQLGGTNAAVAA